MVLLALLAAYLLLWPTPVQPSAWTPPAIPERSGDQAPTLQPQQIDLLFPGLCPGCEDVAVSAGGTIYGSSADGTIYVFRALSAERAEVFAQTGGRPLGMHFDAAENLWVCDSKRGLLKISPEGGVQTMATELNGQRFQFANDLDISLDGQVYFTDASDKYGIDRYKFDILEHRPRGRFFRYTPEGQKLELIADSLYFANGVALSGDDNYALIAETSQYQVRKIWLKGPQKGKTEVILSNLPGYPDGISRGSNGVYWLTLISPRKPLLEKLMPQPILTKMISRLPEALLPKPGRFVHLLGINREGKIIHNIQVEHPNFAQISSVQEAYGQLFLGSLVESGIGRLPVPQ